MRIGPPSGLQTALSRFDAQSSATRRGLIPRLRRLIAAPTIFAALLICSSGAAHAGCSEIITAPCTIEAEGTYTLGASIDLTSIAADGTTGLQIGIKIAPSVANVSINCDTFGIFHNGGYDSKAIGVYGSAVSNVSLVNCNIYGRGLQYGVVIDNMSHPESTGVRISNSAVSASMVGIQVRSQKAHIENNFVHMLGRQTSDPGGSTGGIAVHGAGGEVTIVQNRIYRLENAFNNDVFGISCIGCHNSTIANNAIENNVTAAKSWAFLLQEGTYTVTANTARNFENGFELGVGSGGTLTGTTLENVHNAFVPSAGDVLAKWDFGQSPNASNSQQTDPSLREQTETSSREPGGCPATITAPCTIEAEGTYVLGAGIDATEVTADPTVGLQIGIKIASGVTNVSIDCNTFSIFHNGDYDSKAIGIFGSAVSNVNLVNCSIYGRGLQYGVVIDNMKHPESTGVRISNSSVSASLVGIQVRSQKTHIENNFVHMLGRQTSDPDGSTGGIAVHGAGGEAAIVQNRIYRLENAFNNDVFGISCLGCHNATIANNSVENNVTAAKSRAFLLQEGTYTVTANTARNFEYGFELIAGSSGILTGTTFENVTTAFASSGDALSKWDFGHIAEPAQPEASICPSTITAPCTIESGGTYVLRANINAAEAATDQTTGLQIGLRIAPGVANASIDCDSFGIFHNGGYDSKAVGIYGSGISNVTVANCRIQGSGLLYGVSIDNISQPDSTGIKVVNSVVSTSLVGIQVRSKSTTIENNFVHMMGRQTSDPGGYTGGIVAHGIDGEVTIKDNRIYRLESAFNDEVFGISCAACYKSTIVNNDVENGESLDNSWAFWLRQGTYTLAGNRVKNFEYGFGLVIGSGGTMTDTTFTNVDTAFTATPTDDLSKWKFRNTRNISSKQPARANGATSRIERARRSRASTR